MFTRLVSCWYMNIFEVAVCLVGMVQGEEGPAGLAVGEDGDFQLFIV